MPIQMYKRSHIAGGGPPAHAPGARAPAPCGRERARAPRRIALAPLPWCENVCILLYINETCTFESASFSNDTAFNDYYVHVS